MILPSNFQIEVCVDSIQSAVNAQAGGADRVELCDNLFEGGTTPSAGVIKLVRQELNIGLQVMIRPRGGDFLYDAREVEIMKYDIQVAKDLGADGVVFGCLTPEGNVDQKMTEELIKASEGMNVTFHRAFDMVSDPFRALQDLKNLGVNRILTSGMERTALEGIDLLAELVKLAGEEIIILAGGGVRPYNIQKLVDRTGVKECHVSGRKSVESEMKFKNGRVAMGGALSLPEYGSSVIDTEVIKGFRA